MRISAPNKSTARRFEIPQSSPDGVTAGAARQLAKLAVILDNAGIQRHRNWSWGDYHAAIVNLDASPAFKRWATKRLSMYTANPAGDLAASAARPRDLDFMKAMAPLGVRPTNTATRNDSLAAGMAAAFGGGRQETLHPTESDVAQSMQILPRFPSESLVYAIARLFGLKSATDYLSLNVATVAGYRSVTDEQAALKGGFSRATHLVAGDQQPLPGVGDVTDLSEYSEIPRGSGIQELALELQNASWISALVTYDPVTSIFVRS